VDPDPSKFQFTKFDMHFETVVSAIQLMKAFKAKLWHDSKLVTKQLSKIGNVYSTTLCQHGYDTFEKLRNVNPRDIEFLLKRNPPFASYLIEEV